MKKKGKHNIKKLTEQKIIQELLNLLEKEALKINEISIKEVLYEKCS